MSAPTPDGPAPEGPGLQPPDYGRPSPALIARADRGYARFLAARAPAADPGDHGQDDDAVGLR
ncbi:MULTISPECIES: hypothetical protein [unclassified Streptomyces]|uniref:hypothetical protein n=1 Tax=unclassified Streptomyces TaxID=2593676 RepID=UPI00037CA898|nr:MULTISPECIES: hypothetical protein [unclassified Streptomyces]MYY04746.1 hypothetical protein [Streptomyces sp. SID4913]